MSDVPGAEPQIRAARTAPSIWLFAFGYFAAYVPYALLTKALSNGTMPGVDGSIDGVALLPLSTGVSALGMIVFLAASGLWRRARRIEVLGARLPFPQVTTWISGACTALIVLTTTLAYSFDGTSIVTMMLLMRGGVLVLAPLVDAAVRRHVRWYSWVALVLSLVAVLVAVAPTREHIAVGALAALDAAVYLGAYFGRLGLMSRSAKRDRDANLQFFVEEQLVATPLALVLLGVVAVIDPRGLGHTLTHGALDILVSPACPWAIVIGLCSQATGIFGALVLLDARENSFSVPVNRASSVLAGVVATLALAVLAGGAWPSELELVGAATIVFAIAVLSIGPRLSPTKPK